MNRMVGVLLLAVASVSAEEPRFIVAAPDSKDLLTQVSVVTNTVLNRTSNLYIPTLVNDTTARIDLSHLVDNEEQLRDLILQYNKLQSRDNYFTDRKYPIEPVTESYTEANINGQWVKVTPNQDGTITHNGQRWRGLTTRQTSPQVLKTLIGDTMRLDEWVAFSSSTVNGGLYYQLRGVEKSLGNTIAKFAGADAAKKLLRQAEVLRNVGSVPAGTVFEVAAKNLNDELSKSKALMTFSNVTGRQRLIVFVNGTAMPPTRGVQLVAVTYDLAEDNVDPFADPTRNLLKYEKYNGGEAILHLPNGYLLYLVFDAQDNIIASVPDNVAHDFEARKVLANVSTVRVFGWISCANCHDSVARNWGWQPVDNDVARMLRSNYILDSAKPQELASAYQATRDDLTYMLDTQGRIPYQRAVTKSTGVKSSDLAIKPVALSYWSYWYKPITPQLALRDLGISVTPEEAKTILIRVFKPKKIDDLLEDDILIARLRDGEPLTPTQWRPLIPMMRERFKHAAISDPDVAGLIDKDQ
jgi:hypothetical protein